MGGKEGTTGFMSSEGDPQSQITRNQTDYWTEGHATDSSEAPFEQISGIRAAAVIHHMVDAIRDNGLNISDPGAVEQLVTISEEAATAQRIIS